MKQKANECGLPATGVVDGRNGKDGNGGWLVKLKRCEWGGEWRFDWRCFGETGRERNETVGGGVMKMSCLGLMGG